MSLFRRRARARLRRPLGLKWGSACTLLLLVSLASACTSANRTPVTRTAATAVVSPMQPSQPTPAKIEPTVTLAPRPTPTPPAADLEPQVADLVARMSLEEKVGQLFLVYFDGSTLSPALATMIADYHVGGIVLFQIADNLQSARQAAELINAAQAAALAHGAQIPLFVAVDQEGGPVVRLPAPATHFPSNMAVGAAGSADLARAMAQVTASELKALGINMNLAPVLDVNDNPDNPVIGLRSFGSSPDEVARLGVAMIETYRAAGIIATAKHFPGHGNTSVDSHVGLPVVTQDMAHLRAVELAPFRAAIGAGVDAIMTAHVLFPALEGSAGRPATLSSRVLQDLLRREMGFDGLIVTDSMTMGALFKTYGVNQATELALRAGADVLAFGADVGHTPAEQAPAYRHLLAQVRADPELRRRLDESVQRILRVKAKYGLLAWQPVDPQAALQALGQASHLAAAQQIARASVTLLRDEQGRLPLLADGALLVVWPKNAGNLGRALAACHPNLQMLTVSADPTAAEIDQAVRQARGATAVVVGTADARGRPGQARLVHALSQTPLVVAALQSPYDLLAFPDTSTYLASYGDAPASLAAVADVLCGVTPARGALPVDLPGLYARGSGLRP
ncbi:glycoside hydrolase family 3 protein [Candidatus Amarolinea aalborgensis]|uniref:glycoside hydrolase family 3 protein n=1 Tax=Candidatus Amarolinea aalborgensis TaxID=2249329 RepID=UPI003BF9A40C